MLVLLRLYHVLTPRDELHKPFVAGAAAEGSYL